MKETKAKGKVKNQKAITLIALVITIIVLLILAGVSIATLSGDNGILTRAVKSKTETRAGSIEEKRNLWLTENKTNELTNVNKLKTLDDLLNGLENDKLITIEERLQIEEMGYVIIGSKKISFTSGIEDKKYIVTSSKDEIKFKRTVKEGDILVEKPEYTNYTIEGISTSKEGEFITTGKLDGKSGDLEIVGDIKESTFKFNLLKPMQGDEIFFVKVDIDGEKYFQELNVVQGESVFYEEEFFEYETYEWDYAIDDWARSQNDCWTEIEGDTWSEGKARKAEVNYDIYLEINFECLASKIELVWGQTEKDYSALLYNGYDKENTKLWSYFKILDSENLGCYEFKIDDLKGKSKFCKNELKFMYDPGFDSWELGDFAIVIDGIRIWK